MTLRVRVPPGFRLWPAVHSHGWCELEPFHVDRARGCLKRVVGLSGGGAAVIEIRQSAPGAPLAVVVQTGGTADRSGREEIVSQVRTCLRLDEDLTEFHTETRRHREFRWVSRIGAGRLLRSPTVFEDVVKMICTTNCSWALTKIMVSNLCARLGTPVDGAFSFPAPEAVAGRSERLLRKEVRAGYRAPYLREFALRVAKGELEPESWRSSALPAESLFEELRSVKGVGPYAAANMLKLLGRYDYLGIDSWCRKRFAELHRNGRAAPDRAIESHYSAYGKWKGLFFWLDLTRQWYRKRFPF